VRDSRSGQASAEYVSVLLVVALVLAGAAGAAAAVPGIGERVIRTVRTGICIVGGDVCRSADAAAAGLSPCVVSERTRAQDTTVDLAVVRAGTHGEWQLALQSDGRAMVTRLEEDEAGPTVGVGVTFSPVGLEAAASAALVAGYRGGRAWRFPDVRDARAFLEAAMQHGSVAAGRRPDVRWHAVSANAGAEAAAALAGLASAGFSAAAGEAIGLRTDGPRKTLTLGYGLELPQVRVDLPGFAVTGSGKRTGTMDVTWEHGALRELTQRLVIARGDRVEELSVRLDLRAPESRALAERVLLTGGTDRGAAHALARHMARVGTGELDVYALSEDRSGVSVGGKLGVSLGFSHERTVALRRLVDAVSRRAGEPARRRFDCLGA
jgi:hypothetical protein